jgi:hypothetical protein
MVVCRDLLAGVSNHPLFTIRFSLFDRPVAAARTAGQDLVHRVLAAVPALENILGHESSLLPAAVDSVLSQPCVLYNVALMFIAT